MGAAVVKRKPVAHKPPTRLGLEYAGFPMQNADANPSRIDRENRVIRDVKIVGLESINPARFLGLPDAWGDVLDKPYSYQPEALRDAIPLYEGGRVYIDHPDNHIDSGGRRVISSADRKLEDHFGRLVNVRFVDGDGLRGDLEYLESHPLAQKTLETIERMPEQIGLSHRAYFTPTRTADKVVITSIRSVQSVDLIAERPGTTTSIFESAPMQTDPQAVEDGMEAPAAAAPTDPTAAVKKGLTDAAIAVLSGEGTAAEKLSKLQPLLEQMDELIGVMGGAKPAGEAPAAESGEEPVKTGQESASAAAANDAAILRRKLESFEAREQATAALESAKVRVTSTRVKALAGLPAADRPALIEEFRALDGQSVLEAGGKAILPRSGGGGHAGSGAMTKFDADKFVQNLRDNV